MDVQLLAFNDFHGSLEPPTGANGRIGQVEAGGVEFLTTHLERLKAANPNTLIVSAGDNIGATPLLSGMFHDEPSIEALGLAGLNLSTVGNHEFDEGWWEVYRLQTGGCHPVDGCQDQSPFRAAPFQFLAANVVLDPQRVDPQMLARSGWRSATGRPDTLFPASAIREVNGIRIGFIGLVLRATPEIVLPEAVRGLTFRPEVESANEAAAALVRQGVKAIVVLIHEGGTPGAGATFDSCEGLTGPIVDIATRMSADIDVVVSGHTHQPYNCTIGTKLVTSAASYGRIITDIDLRIDRSTGEVVARSARNTIVTRDVPKSAAQGALMAGYRPFYATLAARVIGTATTELVRAANAAGESALGDVVADAFLAATADSSAGGAVAAFANIGGIRTDLLGTPPTTAGGPRTITYSQVFEVLPFANRVVTRTLTADTILRLLEQQFDNPGPGRRTILQVSSGVAYEFDLTRPAGQRVIRGSVTIAGRPLDPGARYRITTSDFIWGGGDGFSVATEGTEPTDAGIDVDVLSAYLTKHAPVSPGPQTRIRRAP